jgi:hypothetical protein
MYGVQHYEIKFVSDLRQVGGSLRVLPFPPPIKLTGTGIVLYIVKQTCDLDVLKRLQFSIMVRYVCENDRKVFIHSRLVGWSYGV